MADHLKPTLTRILFLLLSCTAAIVAASPSTRPQQTYETSQQHTSSYYPQPQDFPNERLYQAYFVIQRFKKTITCDPMNITSTWTGHDICGNKSYIGLFCTAMSEHGQNLAVTSAVLDGFGLCAPKLEGFIDQLPDLALFQAGSNNFGVSDFPNLAGLTYMYKLEITEDHPSQSLALGRGLGDGGFGNIDFLKLCLLHGLFCLNIPSDISLVAESPQKGTVAGATDARALLLNSNNLSGPLPTNIGFSKLSYLALANNKLTGPIPQSIGQAKDSLLELLLLNNDLSGCLPHELGMLTKTTVIDAGKNQLTGPIPSSFSCLSSVEQLNLGENRLYGQVPDALCKLGRLANLTLSGNYFSSVGPACSALIKDGVLDVKRNCVPGLANQRAPAECASFMSQPKASCPAASAPVSCPAAAAADAKTKMAPEGRAAAKDYASYVTYATLHE